MNARKLLSAAKAVEAAYIEDVFSTYLYTGNSSTQTITNGIDLSGKGGLVWIKNRTSEAGTLEHSLQDTARGINGIGQESPYLITNTTSGQSTASNRVAATLSNGFSLGNNSYTNSNGVSFVSWTFRKQAKFFDVVTYTGNGANRTISHNLGSVPGCIIVKRTDATADWQVYHRSIANTEYLVLNTTAAKATGTTRWNSTTATSTEFSLGTDATVNANGGTYVAYLFAHDAGGFGAAGTDNVISCESFTTSGSGTATVNLGWEPQFVLIKSVSGSNAVSDWKVYDAMRGFPAAGGSQPRALYPNNTSAESLWEDWHPTATGFESGLSGPASTTYIYIAIRRGPMKTPTMGTSVFTPVTAATDNSAITTNFPADFVLEAARGGSSANFYAGSRLTGQGGLITSSTGAELSTAFGSTMWQSNTSVTPAAFGATSLILEGFRRAPGFFDVVCYTGTGVARTVTHNLGVVPELMIVKSRSNGLAWRTYANAIGNNNYLILNSTQASAASSNEWNDTTPTNTVFTVGTSSNTNLNTGTFVAYLFASCPGVSKVGSYTGTGNTLQIDCGFTGGARFVRIKRTDSTGDWYVWDSARGIVAGNDPYLLLNSTAAEVTTTDWVDTYSAGFELSNAGGNNANINTATYIFLAIA